VTAALWAGGVTVGLGVAALVIYAWLCELGARDWLQADQEWRRSGGDISDALSLEVWTRARHTLGSLRKGARQSVPPHRARIDAERLDPLPPVPTHGGP
jgi:hypothetical protein